MPTVAFLIGYLLENYDLKSPVAFSIFSTEDLKKKAEEMKMQLNSETIKEIIDTIQEVTKDNFRVDAEVIESIIDQLAVSSEE
jgi:hypothetical protein